MDKIAYLHTLKELVVEIDSQQAFTKDNVKVGIDGILYYKVTDPIKASYEIKDVFSVIKLMTQTAMWSYIGSMELDWLF